MAWYDMTKAQYFSASVYTGRKGFPKRTIVRSMVDQAKHTPRQGLVFSAADDAKLSIPRTKMALVRLMLGTNCW